MKKEFDLSEELERAKEIQDNIFKLEEELKEIYGDIQVKKEGEELKQNVL